MVCDETLFEKIENDMVVEVLFNEGRVLHVTEQEEIKDDIRRSSKYSPRCLRIC